jgi:putative heme-binding domain-containing protein
MSSKGLFALLCVVLWVTLVAKSSAQSRPEAAKPTVNPLQDDPAAIKNGQAIFRARCAGCHGFDARGLSGPDLTGLYAAGRTDEQLFQIVRRGVPGSEMPPFDSRSQVNEIWETLAYLRTLNLAAAGAPVPAGDAANGERLFRAHCQRCHVVHKEGGVLGPDLSRIGSARPLSVLAEKIRRGGPPRNDYQPVTLTTRTKQQVVGIKKNEDDFSIQVMDLRERLRGYLKSDLLEIVYERRSLMPVYGLAQLNEREFDDLLSYLATLRLNAVR